MSQTMGGSLALTSDRRSVTVLPGRQERLVLTVSNQGSSPLSLELTVQGLLGTWLALQPSVLVLSPTQSSTVMLVFSPAAEAPLGNYPLTIWARARDDTAISARLDLALVLGEPALPVSDTTPSLSHPALYTTPTAPIVSESVQPVGGPLELILAPLSQTTARTARYTLRASNRGTIPLDVELQATDPAGSNSIELHPPLLSLSPSGERTVQLMVRSLKPLQPGETRRVSHFTVEANAKELAQPVLAEGSLTLITRPWWKGPLGWVGAVVGVLVLFLLVWLVWRLLSSTPVKSQVVSTRVATVPQPRPTVKSTVMPTSTPNPSPNPTPSEADIKAAVCDLVNRFQSAKEYAHSTNDTSQLSLVARGEGLARQIQAVDQAKAQGCRWEIKLLEPIQCEVTLKGDSYAEIIAHKRESQLKYCKEELVPADSSKDISYETRYVAEKLEGQWYITWREAP